MTETINNVTLENLVYSDGIVEEYNNKKLKDMTLDDEIAYQTDTGFLPLSATYQTKTLMATTLNDVVGGSVTWVDTPSTVTSTPIPADWDNPGVQSTTAWEFPWNTTHNGLGYLYTIVGHTYGDCWYLAFYHDTPAADDFAGPKYYGSSPLGVYVNEYPDDPASMGDFATITEP